MSVRVKICGLTDSASIDTAVKAGADAVGFVFYEKSPRNLSIQRAIALASSVPDDVLKVAVMLHPDAAVCANILDAVAADILQTDAEDFDYLELPGHVGRWPVVRENTVADTDSLPKRFVYEGASSGQGSAVDWRRAASFAAHGDMILGGGLDPGNVSQAIEAVKPWCVDVSSGVESSPGRKDPHKIAAFIAAAKSAAKIRKG